MKLIGSLTSSYVRKVRMVLAEKKSSINLFWKMYGSKQLISTPLIPWAKSPAY